MIIKAFQTRLLLAFLLCSVSLGVYGIPSQDNINGIWQDLYNDSVGVTATSNVVTTGGVVTMSACDGSVATAEYTTSLIRPSGLSAWNELKLNGIISTSTLMVEARVPGGGMVLASGSSFPLDLSGIDADIHPELEIRVVFTHNAALPCPAVSEISVSWVSEGTFLVQKSAPATVQADNTLLYTLRLSASNTDIENVVVWDTLPALGDATVIQPLDYGQDDSPSFLSANSGGTYTATATTVNGVNVPANSVYWELGLIKAGETILFNYTVKAPNGTINATEYLNDFVAEASNAETLISNEVSTIVLSAPSPSTSKQCSGGALWDGTTCWILSDSTVTFSVSGKNNGGSGRETMLNSVLYDNLTETCAEVSCPSAISNISGGGVFDPAYDPLGSGAFPAIVWPVGTLTPGASSSQSYQVDMTGVAQNTSFNNTICLDSDRTSRLCTTIPLQILDDSPRGTFAKSDDVSPFTRYGSTYSYSLTQGNLGVSKLNDVLMFDRIPDDVNFVTASLPSVANGTIFYSTNTTFNDISIPPDYDVGPIDGVAPSDIDVGANSFWSSIPPANPADVTWVAFYVPQLSSVFTPPADPLTSVSGTISVRVKDDGDLCLAKNIPNRGLFQINGYTDSADTLTVNLDNVLNPSDESTPVAPLVPSINTSAGQWTVSPNPLFLDMENEQVVSFTVSNSGGADRAETVVVDLNWQAVMIDGVLQFPTLVNATGGELDLSDIANGNLGVDIGGLAPGESKTVSLTLFHNTGVLNASTSYDVSAVLTATDNLCGSQTFNTGTRASLAATPALQVLKDVSPTLLSPGSEFDYTLTYTNHGPGVSTGTYVVDAIPDKTVFLNAQLDNGERLYCSAPPLDAALPSGLSPASPIDASMIAASFVLGTDTGGGLWTCPDGELTSWLAVAVDDLALSPPQLGVGIGARSVQFAMRNDEDRDIPQVDSADGTVIFNVPGIFSNELLQAIGNSVLTVASDVAALKIDKTGPGVVSSGKQFIWTLEYENDSSADITTATVTDALPAGMTFVSATHTWNDIAIANGAPSGAQPITRSGDDFAIAPSYRGGDLQGREGGTIEMIIQVDGAFSSGQLVLNTACTNGADIIAVPVPEICDQDIVEVRNAELILNKLASPPDPRAGDTITYTLLVANLNAVDAPDIEVIDTLPAGVTYVPGSTTIVSPAAYSIGEPAVAGQVLSWNASDGNALTHIVNGSDVLPGNSGDIIIQYKVTVDAGLGQGIALLNRAGISTSASEDGVFPSADCGGPVGPVGFQNEDCTTGTITPFPDPSITKNGTTVVNPGDTANWNITYQNSNNEDALDVYVVDSLPDYGDGDADTDVTFLTTSANGPTGNIPSSNIYYNSTAGTAPAFNPASPTDNGWSNTATPTVNHVAWLVGDLPAESGPFTISVTAQMIDPSNGLEVPPGQSFINTTFIATSSTDADPTNNDDDHETITPGVDMSVEKTASKEGAIPGIAPGDTIDYTISFTNTGTVTAYGVYIEDTLPTGVNLTGDTYTVLAMTSGTGANCSAVNSNGDSISTDVEVERLGSATVPIWYLGASSAHQDVGIPVGCTGSFTFTATLDENIAELTVLTNQVRLYTDNRVIDPPVGSPDIDPFDCNELYCDNNEDTTSVTVFLADVMVLKSVVDTASGSNTETKKGNLLTYTIEYDNLGNIAADNVVISEIIPEGTTYVPGSLVLPGSTTATFSPAEDATATDFTVNFAVPLTSPANASGEALDCPTSSTCNLSDRANNIYKGRLLSSLVNEVQQISNTEGGLSTPNAIQERFGYAITGIGDLDGDGIEDMVVTSLWFNGQAGTARVIFLNADGTVKSDRYLGGTVGSLPPLSKLGQDIDSLGDLSGDGSVEIVINRNNGLANAGTHVVSLDASGTVVNELYYDSGADSNFTFSTANLGDLNNDGITDYAYGKEDGVQIVFMNAAGDIGTATQVSIPLDTDAFTNLTGIGDFDGDGNEDLLTADAASHELLFLYLNADGTLKRQQTVTQDELQLEEDYDDFGTSRMNNLGDLDGDGVIEIGLGRGPDQDPTGNRDYLILFLNADGTVKRSDRINADEEPLMTPKPINSSGEIRTYSYSSAYIGDLDNDGYPSIAIGNYADDVAGIDTGSVYIVELKRSYVATGHLEILFSASDPVLQWSSLTVNHDVPQGTTLLYSIGRQITGVCTYDLGAEFVDQDLSKNGDFLDVSSLPATETDLCLRADFATDAEQSVTPTLNSWQMSYRSTVTPSFSFQVLVDDPYQGSGVIDNSVTITTTTPETDYENNDDEAEIFVKRADLSSTKTVDRAAVSLSEVVAGAGTLTYTINYQNTGADSATDWLISDVLPDNVGTPTSIVAANTNFGNTVACAESNGTVYCSSIILPASGDPLNGVLYGTQKDDDVLYGIDRSNLSDNSNTVTMTSATLSIDGTYGLAWNPHAMIMYIVIDDGGDRILATVDLTSGVVTEIGDTGDSVSDIAYDADNNILYALTGSSSGNDLYTVDVSTGALTFVADYDDGFGGAALTWNPDNGLLYHGASEEYWEIDPASPTTPTQLYTDDVGYVRALTYLGGGEFLSTDYSEEFNLHTISGAIDGIDSVPGSDRFYGLENAYPMGSPESSGTLGAGESGTITITVPIDITTPLDSLLTNNVCIESTAWDPTPSNNCDEATTIIDDIANIYVTKDGPASAVLGDTLVYILNYGNNGNIDAVDVVLNDILPANCVYDAAAQALTSPAPDSVVGQTLSWTTLGATPGTLAVGETGMLTVACSALDPVLVDTVLDNNTVITTTTPELTESDNSDDHENEVLLGLAAIHGSVFNDIAQDGINDASDPPIDGVTITLTGTDIFGNPVNLTTTTDAFGDYSFVGLAPSDAMGYTLTETQPTGLASSASIAGQVDGTSTGTSATVDLITGAVLSVGDVGVNYDFGEFIPMEMSKTAGTVTDNGAGVFTVTYTVTATNTANIAAMYSYTDFPTAPAGTTLTSVALAASAASAADISTMPSNGASSASVTDEPIAALGTETWDVTVVFTLTDATLLAAADVCTDQATAEGGFANAIVSITDTDATNNEACLPVPNGVIDLAKSVNGAASNNFDGTYTVEYTITATNTGTLGGSYDVVEDFRPGVGITLNSATVAYGGETDGTDGTITTPLTADGTAVDDESLAAGASETWVINALFDVDTALVTAEGSDCDVTNTGLTDSGFNNNVSGSSTETDLTNNDACTELETPLSSLGDRVWLDENGDGVQDPGEDGIANVTVTLTHSDPTIDLGAGPGVAITRVTDSNGEYLFTELPPGDYTVTVVDTTLASGLAANPTYDEDDGVVGPGGVPSTIHTTAVNLDAGEDHRTADFGYNWSSPGDTDNPDPGALAALGDRIWLDVDGDGAQDAGEAGIAGVTVNLLNEAGAVIATTMTDADGRYIFDDLAAGAYQVEVDDSTLPVGLVQTGDPDDFGIAATNPDHLTTTPIVLAPGDVFVNADFGYQPGTGSDIGDTIYIDSDGDGVEDAGEPGIAGVTVSLLDGAGNVIATTITDARGSYLFESLPAGDYQVVVTDVNNALSNLKVNGNPIDDTGPLDNEGSVITLDGVNDNLDQDFGYVPQGHTAGDGLIGDTIYLDINSDGIEDATDPGIQGVTVRLYDAGGALLDSVQTDANGQYLFGGLDPTATYTVTVDAMTLPTGLYPTADPDDDGIPANGDEDNTSRVDLSLTGGVNLEQDYGYSANNPVTPDDESNSLSGTLWEDLNADGTLTAADEAGRFAGVTIDVYGDPDGDMVFDTLIATTTTDANGDYSVTGLPDGVYEVKVTDNNNVLAGNWHSDGVNDGADNNSQVNGYRVDLDSVNASALGVTDTTSDFGFYNKAGALGNTVWRDLDGDGLFDPATEPGIEGVEVTLLITYPNGDTATLTTTTDLAGHYEFGNLLLDEDGNGTAGSPTYSVSVDMASANNVLLLSQLSSIYVDGTSDSSTVGGAPSDDEDLDVGGDDPSAEPGFPIQGGVDATNDFGFAPTGSIGNRVWQDGDGDGVQGISESGIANVMVTLRVDTDNDGIPDTDVESQVTGPDGEYLFTDVVPGIAYEVVVDDSTLPPGVVQTFDEDDGATTTPATPHASGPIIVSPGEEHLTADFGYQIAPGSIGDTVWVDADGDGIQDPGENGIAGIPVYLQGDTDGDGLPDTVLSTTTDANGKYIFTGLTEGTYVVVVNPSDTTNPVGSGVAPTGYTAHDAGDPDVRFGFSPTADNETTVVLTNEGGTVTSYVDADFGYLPPDDQNNTVGDFVWLDSNGDGVQDAGEAGIAGVTVALIDQATGNVVASTVTDANGGYLFTGVPDGLYEVEVTDTNAVLGGLQQTYDEDDGASLTPTTPNRTVVDVDSGSTNALPEVIDTADFGYFNPTNPTYTGVIGDTVFFDVDGNGVQDASENGLEGVWVGLYTPGPDGVFGTADDVLVGVENTNENGQYSFSGLPTSDTGEDYQVRVDPTSLPNSGAGWVNSADPDAILDGVSEVTLTTATPVDLDQDFGYQGDVGGNNAIEGTLWVDNDGDGMLIESGRFENVSIELLDTNGNIVATTLTDVNGNYRFEGLPDGIYTVVVTDVNNVLAGYQHTDGPTPGSDLNSQNDQGYTVDLDSANAIAEAVLDVTSDFGYEPAVSNPITMGTFTSEVDGGRIWIRWSTQVEVGNVGFHLYGKVSNETDWVRLNEDLIIGAGDSIAEHQYEYLVFNEGYKAFLLSDVDIYGKEQLHGPYRVNRAYGVKSSRKATDWQAIKQGKAEKRKAKRLRKQRKLQRKLNRLRQQPVSQTSEQPSEQDIDQQGWFSQAADIVLSALVGEAHASQPNSPEQSSQQINRKSPERIESLERTESDQQQAALKARTKKVKAKQERKRRVKQKLDRLRQQPVSQNVQPGNRLRSHTSQSDTSQSDTSQSQQQTSEKRPWFELAASVLLAAFISDAEAQTPSSDTSLVNLLVNESRVYALSHADLMAKGINLAGIPLAELALIDDHGAYTPLELDGSQADETVFGAGATLRFIGDGQETLYSDQRAYTLVRTSDLSSSTRILDDPSDLPQAATSLAYRAQVSHAPQAKYSYNAPGDDPWYAERLLSVNENGDETSIQLPVDYVVTGSSIRPVLSVSVWGATDLPGATADHHVQVLLNGSVVKERRFDGIRAETLAAKASSLSNGNNQVVVRLPHEHGFVVDQVNLESVTLSYPRAYVSDGLSLRFSSSDARFSVRKLNSKNTAVYRRDRNGEVHRLSKAVQSGICDTGQADCVVSFAGYQERSEYFVETLTDLAKPEIALIADTSGLFTGAAEYVIIAHSDFIDVDSQPLQALIEELNGEFNGAALVDVEAVMAAYGHVADADAIKQYIKQISKPTSANGRGTRYVLLVGADMVDYHHYLNDTGVSFIPTLYRQTDPVIRHAPVDSLFADIDGDQVQDIAIGRLPVRTEAELLNVMNKRSQYLQRSYKKKAVFLADQEDIVENYDFGKDADSASAAYFSDWQVTQAQSDDLGNSQARTTFIQAINQGQSLASYYGHSSTAQWSFNGLFTGDDVTLLNNQNRPTVVTQWGCWNTYYVSPTEDSMAVRLLLEDNKGAVSVMGASTFTEAHAEKELSELVYQQLAAGARLGDAMVEAKQQFAEDYPYQLDVLLGWTLLGFPELRIH